MAAIALGIGLALLLVIPESAPINRGNWGVLGRTVIVLFFPAVVYVAFVFYGGQKVAYEARQVADGVPCPHCRQGRVLPGETCRACGQTISI